MPPRAPAAVAPKAASGVPLCVKVRVLVDRLLWFRRLSHSLDERCATCSSSAARETNARVATNFDPWCGGLASSAERLNHKHFRLGNMVAHVFGVGTYGRFRSLIWHRTEASGARRHRTAHSQRWRARASSHPRSNGRGALVPVATRPAEVASLSWAGRCIAMPQWPLHSVAEVRVANVCLSVRPLRRFQAGAADGRGRRNCRLPKLR